MPQACAGIFARPGDKDSLRPDGAFRHVTRVVGTAARTLAVSDNPFSISVSLNFGGHQAGRTIASGGAPDPCVQTMRPQATAIFAHWESHICAADIWVTEKHTRRVSPSIPDRPPGGG